MTIRLTPFQSQKTSVSLAPHASSTLRRHRRKPQGSDHSPGGGLRHRPLAPRAHRLREQDYGRADFAMWGKGAATTNEAQWRAEGRSQAIETRSDGRGPGRRDEIQSKRGHRRLGKDNRRLTIDLRFRAASPEERRADDERRQAMATDRRRSATRTSGEMGSTNRRRREGCRTALCVGARRTLSEAQDKARLKFR